MPATLPTTPTKQVCQAMKVATSESLKIWKTGLWLKVSDQDGNYLGGIGSDEFMPHDAAEIRRIIKSTTGEEREAALKRIFLDSQGCKLSLIPHRIYSGN